MANQAPFLIFGATGGVGSALSHRLARSGVPVFLTSRSEDRLARLAQDINANYAVCDVNDASSIDQVVQAAAAEGALAGLAFCVGSIVVKPLKNASGTDFLDAFRLNVLSPAMAVKSAQSALVAGAGSVVLFSTVAVAQGFMHHSVISAAKGGVEGLTRALAAELAPKVRVNAIAPSLTQTPLAAQFTKSETIAKSIAQLHAISRLGEAEDIAAAAAYLLGRESSWITGQVLAVDGGRSRVRTKG